MLMFIWFCVMTSAFFPGGARIASMQADAFQNQIRASVETPHILTLGWASRDAELTAPPSAPAVHDRIRAAQAALEALPTPTPRARKPRRALAAA